MTEPSSDPTIKIFHLITNLAVGGEQYGMLTRIQGLSHGGYQHSVCSVMDKGPMARKFEEIGTPVFELGIRKKYDLRVYWRLWRLLRRERPDILHTHLIHANLLGRAVGRLAGVKTIIASEVTVGKPRWFGTLINRITNRLVDRIETNASAVQQWLHETYKTPLDKIQVILSGIEIEPAATHEQADATRRSLDIPTDDVVILFVGRLEEEKGAEFGVRAFVKIANELPLARFVLVGEGSEQETLEKIVRSEGVGDRINLIGPRDDIPALMAMSEMVFLPSLTEGLSRVILEAMVASRAVVATRVGGSGEVVVDGETGLMVSSRDVNEMADALRKILGDASLSKRMGQAGRKRVETEYSKERYLDQVNNMYVELAGRHTSIPGREQRR
jgi:glycosyltransferase involved in cell wall biosynthesis